MVRARAASWGGGGGLDLHLDRMGLRWDRKQIKKDKLKLCFLLQHLPSSVTLSSHTPNKSQSTKYISRYE